MTDLFLMQFCTVRYDHKPFEQIKSEILTCCVEHQRHQDFFEVQHISVPKCHTKYKQTINSVDTLILI